MLLVTISACNMGIGLEFTAANHFITNDSQLPKTEVTDLHCCFAYTVLSLVIFAIYINRASIIILTPIVY